eukprot:2824892-Rhodomonas_salina.1
MRLPLQLTCDRVLLLLQLRLDLYPQYKTASTTHQYRQGASSYERLSTKTACCLDLHRQDKQRSTTRCTASVPVCDCTTATVLRPLYGGPTVNRRWYFCACSSSPNQYTQPTNGTVPVAAEARVLQLQPAAPPSLPPRPLLSAAAVAARPGTTISMISTTVQQYPGSVLLGGTAVSTHAQYSNICAQYCSTAPATHSTATPTASTAAGYCRWHADTRRPILIGPYKLYHRNMHIGSYRELHTDPPPTPSVLPRRCRTPYARSVPDMA